MTYISDEACPHGKSVLKAFNRIFSIKDNDERVYYSSLDDPFRWTERDLNDADDDSSAGFIDPSQYSGGEYPTALAAFRGRMLVFYPSTTQVWALDADPAEFRFLEHLRVGTRHERSVADTGDNVLFLSPRGFRSIEQQREQANLREFDAGSPVDADVKDVEEVRFSFYSPRLGQYWCGVVSGDKIDRVHVLSAYRTNRVLAWSRFDFGELGDEVKILDGVENGGSVYLLADVDDRRQVLRYDEGAGDEQNRPIRVKAVLNGSDMGAPGVIKHIKSVGALASKPIVMQLFDWRPEREGNPFIEVPLDRNVVCGVREEPLHNTGDSGIISPGFEKDDVGEPVAVDVLSLEFVTGGRVRM